MGNDRKTVAVEVRLKLTVDIAEWNEAYGDELTADEVRHEAQYHLGAIVAGAVTQHGMATVVTVNGQLAPTV